MIKALLLSAAFVAAYNLLFYPAVLGVGFPLFILAVHAFIFVVRDKNSKNTAFAVVLSALSILFAVFCVFKSNSDVQGVNVLAVLFLTASAAFYYKQKTIFSSDIMNFFLSPLKAVFELFRSCFTAFSNKSLQGITSKHSKVYGPLFQGLLLAIPILIILFLLLLGADPIFRTIVGNFSFSISSRLVVSIIVFLMAFFWGVATVVSDSVRDDRKWSEERGEKFALSSLVIAGAVALLFAIFLSVQLRYLFLVVPETELHKLGINVQTYSEYVRQGFFALLFASAIATAIIIYILRNLHLIRTIHKKYLQIIVSILTLETVLLLVSAGKRLFLYTDAHGLSHIRIYGAFFLVWLAGILLLVLFLTFKRVRRKFEFWPAFLITVVTIVALNIVPIDRLIAIHYPPTVNHEIDTWYVARLSPEASDAWIPLIRQMQSDVEKLSSVGRPTDEDWRISHETRATIHELGNRVYYLDRKYGKENYLEFSEAKFGAFHPNTSWQAFNWSEYEAYKTISNKKNEFEQLMPLYESLDAIWGKWASLPPAATPSAQ